MNPDRINLKTDDEFGFDGTCFGVKAKSKTHKTRLDTPSILHPK